MKSTDRLLNILSYIASCGKPVFPKNISQALNIPLSSVYRILNILIEWEFVTPSRKYGAYTLGAQSLKGQHLHQTYSIFNDDVDAVLQNLCDVTGESAGIVVADYTETICIKMVESEQALRCSFLPGRVNQLTLGASGKTLLAFKEAAIGNAIIEHAYPKDCIEKETLITDLARIRAQGYGRTMGEIDPGVLGISAPIFRHQSAIAVVTLMAPYFRGSAHETQWIEAILEASAAITALIGHDQ
ncbi:transcriptional regulator [Wohlfahrtiimonas chitiniclastica]|nr:transcriptional regulator [Wohlfahrtiimonas chitiniclastica]